MPDRVTAYDHFRYLVRSFNEQREYLVDISENDWIGQCDCPHWVCRLGPKIAQGERLYCKHVRAAREVALDDIGRRLQKELEKQNVRRGPVHQEADQNSAYFKAPSRSQYRVPEGR